MTLEEFDNAKWHKGMICYNNYGKKLNVVGVDFVCGLILAIDPADEYYHKLMYYSEIKLESK